MQSPVNNSQEVLYNICFEQELITPKRVGFRLHRSRDYISDICRRDRVDYMAVFNEMLKEAEAFAATNPMRLMAVAVPIFRLLTQGTTWVAHHISPEQTLSLPYERLCEQTGTLLKDLGGAIEAIAKIEADGQYDEADDVNIEEFVAKAGILGDRLAAMVCELTRRRMTRAAL